MTKVKCKGCIYIFKPKMKERILSNDIRELYLRCPKCKDETRIAVTSKETRYLSSQINKLKDAYEKDKSNEFILKRIDALSKELKEKMDSLNSRA